MSCCSRLRWAALGWALLLLLGASCLTSPSAAAEEGKAGCEKHTNCSSCISTDLSEMNCTWIFCNDSLMYCADAAEKHNNCTPTLRNGTCSDSPNATTVVAPTAANTSIPGPTPNTTMTPAHPTSVRPTSANTTAITPAATNTTSTPGSVSPKPTSKPSPHKSTFDAASFIGGIVLVLGLQAVIFFLYKFCKSKEQNYHTL